MSTGSVLEILSLQASETLKLNLFHYFWSKGKKVWFYMLIVDKLICLLVHIT